MNHRMSKSDLLELKWLFDRWATEDLDQDMANAHRRTAERILSQIPLSPDDNVLDIGTGNGFAARLLASQEPRADIYGIDLSEKMIQNASTHKSESEVEYMISDMHSLPVCDNIFDYIFMMDVIEYSPNPDQALQEIYRVLRPKGQLYCANLFYQETVNIQPELADRDGIHLCWSKQEFRSELKKCGFTSIEQLHIPDDQIPIPSGEICKKRGWDSRAQAKTVYRELGTLLTIGVTE